MSERQLDFYSSSSPKRTPQYTLCIICICGLSTFKTKSNIVSFRVDIRQLSLFLICLFFRFIKMWLSISLPYLWRRVGKTKVVPTISAWKHDVNVQYLYDTNPGNLGSLFSALGPCQLQLLISVAKPKEKFNVCPLIWTHFVTLVCLFGMKDSFWVLFKT